MKYYSFLGPNQTSLARLLCRTQVHNVLVTVAYSSAVKGLVVEVSGPSIDNSGSALHRAICLTVTREQWIQH